MKHIYQTCCLVFFTLLWLRSNGQNDIFINLAPIDGIDITPDNLFSYQIQSNLNRSSRCMIKGTIRYRQSGLMLSYQYIYNIVPGINQIARNMISPQMTYSSNALKELFEYHKKLPEGIYEYCVAVQADYQTEGASEPYTECLYHKSEDIFLINLIDPPDNAKIHEYNPMLTWTVNYPFANELTYRLRVAEVKKGQNAASAINRNNAIFDQRDLKQLSLIYPVYAKPLQEDQPYAWTVDAYYKGILIGGAAPWIFTIVQDSFVTGIPKDPSYVDIKKETGSYSLYAPGKLKLKYVLDDLKTDTLRLVLYDQDQKEVKLIKDFQTLNAKYGDNRYDLDLAENQPLKHLKKYTLIITSMTGKSYRILFEYINPDFIK